MTGVNTVKQTHVKIVGPNDLIAASRLHLLSASLQLGVKHFDTFHTDQTTTFSVPPLQNVRLIVLLLKRVWDKGIKH